MKILVAMDSFKGSLSSLEAGNAVKEGILSVDENTDVVVKTFADGGEGSIESVMEDIDGRRIDLKVHNPLGEIIDSYYVIKDGKAFIEMAKCSGLELIPESKRDPMVTSSFGVGEMIRDAIHRGIRSFVVFIGGSATNDGGCGMLKALGYRFYDEFNNLIPAGGGKLNRLNYIDESRAMKELKDCNFIVASDVKNPLCGENGASMVYSIQKGADEKMAFDLDYSLKRLAKETYDKFGIDYSNKEGAGAAGGIGFAFMAFLGGKIISGVDAVIEYSDIKKELEICDVLVTGEGKFDRQSFMGKAAVSLCAMAKECGVKTVLLCGSVESEDKLESDFVDGYFSIIHKPMEQEELTQRDTAYRNLKNTAKQVFGIML
ncbi:glycerate kinase [Anaerofustis sp.]|uniref:glycerate kinase family protein n=1 Tax=Anaerofustis sp. TaxID=1872517 RepID=UPI0025C71308|nr:glycerate kinase [Anaerofustis sp.]